jgi:uncharacterized integral membrane protein
MKTPRIFLAFVILVVLFIFSVNNAQSVQLIIFSYRTPPLPLFLILLFIFALGFFLAALLSALKISQLRRQLAQLHREAEALRKDGSSRQIS